MKKYSDIELMKILSVDRKTLERFKQIQKESIVEAKRIDIVAVAVSCEK
mgnify:CR=1 FL=1